MITAVHTLIYSDDPQATRAFFRDVLQLPFVADDNWEGPEYLIFDTGASEVGVRATNEVIEGEHVVAPRHHQMSFMVDDVEAAAADIRARGADVVTGPKEMGFGVGMEVAVPGTDAILLYQPHHATTWQPTRPS